jgi:thymidylate synthase (FAD)
MQNVSLQSYSQEVKKQFDQEKNIKSVQDLVEYYARVSNPSGQNEAKVPGRLIKYLVDHKHWSPLEMVSACLEVNTTRDIARQLLRHRSFSFQEFSQRYADPTNDLAFTVREARLQDEKNRQNSIDTNDDELKKAWALKQQQVIHEAKLAYKWAIENGIAKEQARSVLPEGNTNSRLYVNGTLRSWVHYIELRTTEGTQLEHRELALQCGEALRPIFPMIDSFIHFRRIEKEVLEN